MMNADPSHGSNINSLSPNKGDKDILTIAASNDRTPLHICIEENIDLSKILNNVYYQDPMFSKIMAHLEAHPRFNIQDGLIWTKNRLKRDVISIPQTGFQGGRRVIKIIIDHAHLIVWPSKNFELYLKVILVARHGSVRGQPVFHSEAVSEFYQL